MYIGLPSVQMIRPYSLKSVGYNYMQSLPICSSFKSVSWLKGPVSEYLVSEYVLAGVEYNIHFLYSSTEQTNQTPI